MHPYRQRPAAAKEPRSPNEELVLYAALVAIGAIPVIVALAGAIPWGFDATLGVLMTAAGVIGLWRLRR